MRLIRKHFALAWGYDLHRDCRHSLTICLGARTQHFMGARYRFIFRLYWNWPEVAWTDETWALNEEGYIRGMPVARRGVPSSLWTGRPWHISAITWFRGVEINRYA